MNELLHELKRKELLSEMKKYSSFSEWGRSVGKSRQYIQQMIKYYALEREWKTNSNMKKYRMDVNLDFSYADKKPGVARFIFTNINVVYVVSSKTDIRTGMYKFIWKIKNKPHLKYLLPELRNFECNLYTYRKGFATVKWILDESIKAGFICPQKTPDNTQTKYEQAEKLYRKKYADLPTKKSPYKGMTWVKRSQSWKLQPFIKGKQVYIGYAKTTKDGIKKIKDYIKEHS